MISREILTRSMIIGHEIASVVVWREQLDTGFQYVEAIIALDNGMRFAIDQTGVDEVEELVCYEDTKIVTPALEFESVIGERISHLAIVDYVATLVVVTENHLIFGSDEGAPFDCFGPFIDDFNGVVNMSDLQDFWTREPVT